MVWQQWLWVRMPMQFISQANGLRMRISIRCWWKNTFPRRREAAVPRIIWWVLANGLQRMTKGLKRVLKSFYVKCLSKRSMEKMSYLIKDTTKQERIELIRSWVPKDEVKKNSSIICIYIGVCTADPQRLCRVWRGGRYDNIRRTMCGSVFRRRVPWWSSGPWICQCPLPCGTFASSQEVP